MTLVTISASAIALLTAILLTIPIRAMAWVPAAGAIALLAGWSGGYFVGWLANHNMNVGEDYVMLLFATAFWAGLAGALFGTSIGPRLRHALK